MSYRYPNPTPRWRGTWSNAVTYDVGDGVSYLGSSYVALLVNLNVVPTTMGTWEVLAQKGDTGATGAAGAAGAAGATGATGFGAIGYWGDGSDGSVTFDGSALGFASLASTTYTLNRNIYCTDITVNNTYTVNMGGYGIFFTGTLTNNGSISRNGNNGNGVLAGATLAGHSYGSGATGGGGSTTGGTAGTASNNSFGGAGGAGGNTGANNGGAGGAATAISVNIVLPRSLPWAVLGVGTAAINTTVTGYNGGGGGGGGSGGGVNQGGGGGGGGGYMVLCGQHIVNNGTVSANGGDGANAVGVIASGGGGGGGGVVVIVASTYTGSAPTANGGAGGAGNAGANGANGSAGRVISLVG